MFSLQVGRSFELSIQRDFLLRVGKRELFFAPGEGWSLTRVSAPFTK